MATKDKKESAVSKPEPEQEAELHEGPDDPNEPAGVPEGTELQTTEPDGSVHTETIVHDKDDGGNIIGYHKE